MRKYHFLNILGFEPKTFGLKVHCSTTKLYILFLFYKARRFYKAKSIKKAIIKENNAIASVKAKPKIANLNNSSFKDGFLEIPITKEPKTVPIPTPAPANPIVANPAPINLADCNNIYNYKCIVKFRIMFFIPYYTKGIMYYQYFLSLRVRLLKKKVKKKF